MRNVKRFLCILIALQAAWNVPAKRARKKERPRTEARRAKETSSIDKAKAAATSIDVAQEAAELQEKADAGDAAAQRELGIHYYYGWGVARDPSMATLLFSKAAEQGDAIAMRMMGLWYESRGDSATPFVYYKQAAEAGDGKAQHLVGNCYANGFGVERNSDERKKWHSKALETLTAEAEQGDKEAAHYLGSLYIYGWRPVKQSNAKGLKLWLQAAEAGYVPAMNDVGYFYSRLANNKAEMQNAVDWFTLAAELGDMVGQYNLALTYTRNGWLVMNADWGKGVEWYTKSAEQGYANAQYELGLCYRDGNGVKKDRQMALMYLGKAANQGHKEALAAYNNMLKEKDTTGV